MATTNDAPFGLRPVRTLDSSNIRVGYYKVAASTARIFKGDALSISGGYVKTATSASGPFIGVAAQDSGGVAPSGGIDNFPVFDSPNLVFEVQAADASNASQADLLAPKPLVLTTGNTTNGLSKHEFDIDSSLTSGVRALRLAGQPDNALQDGGIVQVVIDNHSLA